MSGADAIAVGKRIPRVDAREKVEGRAQYVADLYRPGMLHGAILASPYAHARILRYDLTEALEMPGVRAIVTGDDFAAANRMGAFVKDEHAIAKGKVRYVGEPVAAVAADTEREARAAALAIRVDYAELPALLAPEEALASSVAIHEDLASYFKIFDTGSHGNLCSRTDFIEGDIERGFRDSDLVVEHTFETQAQNHVALEPCGALAEVDPQGRVTLWSGNQSVFRVQACVSEALGIPMSRIRCLTPRIGGGFGNKMEPHIQPITVALALKARRAVKLILSREEDFEMVRARHPFKLRVKTGVKRDGTFVAREVEALLDCGAFGDDSPGVLGFALLCGRGPYRFQHVRCHGKLAYTNKLRFGAFRGFGNPQMSFATESQIDEIAAQLGMDPIELRLKNILREDDRWFGGQTLHSNGLRECIERVRAASGWQAGAPAPSAPQRQRALGFALSGQQSGLLGTGAIVRLLEDGTVVLNVGSNDIGQGSDTVLTQMCAEALKVPVERIAFASPDTDGSPFNWGTTASRLTYMTGRSVVGAAQEVEKKILQHAAEMLECATEDLELVPGGMVAVKGVQQRQVSFFEVAKRAHWQAGGPIIGSHAWVFDQPTIDPKRAVAVGLPFPRVGVYSFCAMVVDSEIDEVTGKVEVKRAWSACDIGKAINPTLVEGQIEGAFVQGMGYALVEEMVWDGGRLANPTLMDYKIPTIKDTPYEINAIIVESHDASGPFGAKGVGEVGIVPVAPAIANAIKRATGVRLQRLPLTAERVLRGVLGT
jgi:CO/xanthine dehydrogenase Mo-binding subunit